MTKTVENALIYAYIVTDNSDEFSFCVDKKTWEKELAKAQKKDKTLTISGQGFRLDIDPKWINKTCLSIPQIHLPLPQVPRRSQCRC